VPVDRLRVDALLDVADGDGRLERRAEGAVGEELDERDCRVLFGYADRGRDVAPLQRVAGGEEVGKLGQEAPGGVLPFPFTEDGDLASAGLQADAEGLFDGPQVFVGDSEEGGQPGFRQDDRMAGVRNRRSSLRKKTVPRRGRAPGSRAPAEASNLWCPKV